MTESNIISIGIPPLYENPEFKDPDAYFSRFIHFTLIPLAYEGIGVFSYNIDLLTEAKNVPTVKLFPKEPPVVSYTISNNLDDNLLNTIISGFSHIGSIVKTFAPGLDLGEFGKNVLSEIPVIGGGLSALAHAFSGYGVALPKVWTGSEWGISLKIDVEEHLWAWGSEAPQRFKQVMDALKNFTTPRLNKPKAEGNTTIGNQVTQGENSSLSDYFYTQPYFCRILNRERKVLIPAALVTNVSFNIDTRDMIVIGKEQYPATLKVELEFAPLHFSLVADPENRLANKNLMSFEKLIKGWVENS